MRKFAPIAMLMALMGALLMGGATAASAGPSTDYEKNYQCDQVVGVNVVSCNEVNVGDIDVDVEGNRVLTDNELSILENNLNNADADINVIKDVVVKTYKSFNPSIDITKNDVTVCIGSVCD